MAYKSVSCSQLEALPPDTRVHSTNATGIRRKWARVFRCGEDRSNPSCVIGHRELRYALYSFMCSKTQTEQASLPNCGLWFLE